MNIFKSMKLKARLISAFILMAFVAGVVGVIGYVNMREINGMANQIYNSDLLGLDAAAKARRNVIAVGRYLRAAMLADTEQLRQKYMQSAEQNLADIKKAIDEARPKFVSPEGKALFVEFDRIYPEYEQGIEKVEQLVFSEPLRQASASNAYLEGEFAPVIDKMMAQVGKIVDQKLEHSAQRASDAHDLYEQSSMIKIGRAHV
jgi:methyl-accepting chemotaxis protein